jgi:hypothetical protein
VQGRKPSDCDIELGLAILRRRTWWLIEQGYDARTIGTFRTCQAIAAYSGCSRQNIQMIYEGAMRKIRVALRFRNKELWQELTQHVNDT